MEDQQKQDGPQGGPGPQDRPPEGGGRGEGPQGHYGQGSESYDNRGPPGGGQGYGGQGGYNYGPQQQYGPPREPSGLDFMKGKTGLMMPMGIGLGLMLLGGMLESISTYYTRFNDFSRGTAGGLGIVGAILFYVGAFLLIMFFTGFVGEYLRANPKDKRQPYILLGFAMIMAAILMGVGFH